MKLIHKLSRHHFDGRRGETIIEVVVAFALLTIMLVIFSQGLAYASRSDIKAMQTREAADKAMLLLQQKKITESEEMPIVGDIDYNLIHRKLYSVEVDGETYTYVVYSTGD